jgi:hypothetical protein
MKKSAIIAMATLTLVVGIFTFGSANATCTKQGYIIRVTTFPGSSNTTVYLRTSALATGYFYGFSTDAKIADAALSALTNRTYVSMQGNIASCPTSGNVGTLNYIVVSP